MEALTKWHNDALGKRAAAALGKNRFAAVYFSDRESAVAHVLSLVAEGSSVGIGGSKTEKTLGISDKLKAKGCTIFDHNGPGVSKEEKPAIRHKQLASDVFVSSSNAVTLTGELVNVDATGNRVAAMIFGPKRVIVIVGTNKIVRNLEDADKRIRMTAAPLNNKRLERGNPCLQTGECVDCHSATRICNVTTIMRRPPSETDVHVVIIGEELGY